MVTALKRVLAKISNLFVRVERDELKGEKRQSMERKRKGEGEEYALKFLFIFVEFSYFRFEF